MSPANHLLDFAPSMDLFKATTYLDGRTTFILLSCALLFRFGITFVPWILEHKRRIDASKLLPGPPVGRKHNHPWTQEIGTFLTLPSVPGRPNLPLAVPHLIEQCIEYSKEENGAHGLFRIWAFNPYRVPFARCIVHVFDPNLIDDILGPRGYMNFSKGHIYNVARPLVGNSMLTLNDGHDWKEQRKLASPGFNHGVLERTSEVATEILTEHTFKHWDDLMKSSPDKPVDMVQYMLRLTLDVIGEVAFSYAFNSSKEMNPHNPKEIKESSMYYVFDTMIETIMIRCLSLPLRALLPTKENKKFNIARKRLNSVVKRIVEERIKEQEMQESSTTPAKSSKRYKDLLSQIMTKDEGGSRLKDRYIIGNIQMFLFAGHDTTAMTLSYAIWHLASNPEVQERLHKEVLPLFSTSGRVPTYSELRNLRFLDAIIKETLRMNAPAGIGRRALRDVTIGGKGDGKHIYKLPKGCQVYVYPWFVQRHPKHWDEPDKFDPDRFLSMEVNMNERGEGATPSGKNPFLPFSLGPRNCIGLMLAQAELRATLAHIVHRYKLEPADKAREPTPMFMMTVAPNEVMVKITKRM
mmetsp:Transcript_19094/g.38713  ORF Transcript_19094/g.38713 Transcript_19094/m.38713 type:complete len:579 (-) Transcript_19094:215-1951(-)